MGKARPKPAASASSGLEREAEAGRWSRLAPLLLECHRALINTRDEAALVREVCRLLVRRGGYRAAWICLKGDDPAGGFRLAARCGPWTKSGRGARVPCAAEPQRVCPLAASARDALRGCARQSADGPEALRGCARQSADGPGTADRAAFSRAPLPPHAMVNSGGLPLLILPLKESREVLGVLHVSFKDKAMPGGEEVQWLKGLAANLAVRLARLRAGWQHRQTKNAVIETLRRFHASLQATPLVAVQRVDREGVVRHWNAASSRLYGYKSEQALERRLTDLLLEPEEAAGFERLLDAAWSTGQGATPLEWTVICADGRRRTVGASLIPIREHNRTVDLFCMEVDVTDRRRAEEALRDSEARYRDLVDAAPWAVLVHQEGIVRFANAAALELLGAHQPDELCWRPLVSLVHPEAQGRLEELAREGSPRAVELELVRLDGGVVDAEVASLPLRWENRPAGQWLIRDRTLTTRMQRELDTARGKLARIFESSPAAILICSLPDDRLLEANPAFWRLVGYDREELLGRTLAELGLAGEDAPALTAPAPRRQGRDMPSFEARLETRAGERRQVLVSVDDFDFGAQRSRLLIMIDITERKRLESDLRQSQKLEAMGLLARGVAHDLNNILTVIQGHQSLIAIGSRLAPQAHDSLAGISEAVARASDLTRQLLSFSRQRPMEASRLDLNQLIASLAKLLRRMLGQNIELKLRCAPRLRSVWADPGMLEQVLVNLAVNARDAMPRGGRLTVSTELRFVRRPPLDQQPAATAGDYLCLTVQDTGLGIAPENLGRVFDPFFTTKTVAKGTGLGLATVNHIVQRHHGWIEVESSEGKGTTFRLYLPAVAEPAASARKLEPAAAAPTRQTILLVEDEPAVRDLARQVLERSGYRVLAAEDSSAATRLWRRHGADIRLLIADLVLPGGLDGGELAQRLQAERPDLRVILSTGYGADFETGSRPALNAARLLPKPFAPDALARYVRECLDET